MEYITMTKSVGFCHYSGWQGNLEKLLRLTKILFLAEKVRIIRHKGGKATSCQIEYIQNEIGKIIRISKYLNKFERLLT